jgi:hypothetical protein
MPKSRAATPYFFAAILIAIFRQRHVIAAPPLLSAIAPSMMPKHSRQPFRRH